MDERSFYVAEDPNQPLAAYAACVDAPQYKKETAESIEKWENEGATVYRVDAITMLKMMNAWCRPNT